MIVEDTYKERVHIGPNHDYRNAILTPLVALVTLARKVVYKKSMPPMFLMWCHMFKHTNAATTWRRIRKRR